MVPVKEPIHPSDAQIAEMVKWGWRSTPTGWLMPLHWAGVFRDKETGRSCEATLAEAWIVHVSCQGFFAPGRLRQSQR